MISGCPDQLPHTGPLRSPGQPVLSRRHDLWRGLGLGLPVAESEAILGRFLELGGNFIDTANVYTKGHSEEIIGDYFARSRAPRSRRDCHQVRGNLYLGDPNGGGAGRKSIVAACEQSLRRLKTDYIDLYWMHFWDQHTPIDETMRALDDLVRAGKVRYLGFSDTPAWKVTQGQLLAQFRAGRRSSPCRSSTR